jgi:hypothetical protein
VRPALDGLGLPTRLRRLAGHLGADRAQLGHDLAMHRADIAAFAHRASAWRVAD